MLANYGKQFVQLARSKEMRTILLKTINFDNLFAEFYNQVSCVTHTIVYDIHTWISVVGEVLGPIE